MNEFKPDLGENSGVDPETIKKWNLSIEKRTDELAKIMFTIIDSYYKGDDLGKGIDVEKYLKASMQGRFEDGYMIGHPHGEYGIDIRPFSWEI